MRRVIVLLLDSFGVGYTKDADEHDKGANTFVNLAKACFKGLGDNPPLRQGPLNIPHLTTLGLIKLAKASSQQPLEELPDVLAPTGIYGFAAEKSLGKDTPSGHWEIAGVPVVYEWGYFPYTQPCFPDELIEDFISQTKLPGILGNKHASGTEIIKELGEEHIRTGKPIVYTSADSVFQIAAHEESFGLEKLEQICEVARKLVDKYKIGRVIARPFLGEGGNFYRTHNRKDYASPPPEPTLFDALLAQGGKVIAIGKTADIYAHQGISETIKAGGNQALFDVTLTAMKEAQQDKTLIFTNFVDFDMLYGHRRDIPGYAYALEVFDARLPELMAMLQPGDLVILTADHGCDPTWPGSDHTREHIPILMFGPKLPAGFIGERESFADIGQTIATYLQIKPLKYGKSFLTSDNQWEFVYS